MRRKAAVAVMLLILAVATYASQGGAAAVAWPGIAIAILGSGTLAAFVTNALNRRQIAATTTNVDAKTINTNAGTINSLSEQVRELLEERAAREEETREMRRQLAALEEEVRELRDEVERLTNAARPGRKTDTEMEPTIVPPTPRMPIGRRRR